MPKPTLRKGTEVLVITGRDKGKRGTVLSVDRENSRVFVSGVNLCKKHKKPTKAAPGDIVTKELSVHLSNVKPL